MTDLIFEKYRSRLAYQNNEDSIKVFIREGLSPESQKILEDSECLRDRNPSLMTEYEKKLMRRRKMAIQRIHRIFKKLEFEIYGALRSDVQPHFFFFPHFLPACVCPPHFLIFPQNFL